MHRPILMASAAVLASALAGTAFAQQSPPPGAPAAPAQLQQLPTFQGRVAQYSLTPRGDVDGLILDNGTEVHFPLPLSTQLVYTVRPGDTVTVRGLKSMASPIIDAMSITNDATGQTVINNGPRPGPHGPAAAGQLLTAQGQVREALHGPRGELNGVLLTDGTIIRVPPPEAQRLASDLVPGAPVYATGYGYAGPLGKVIAAQSIGPNPSQQMAIAAPPPPQHGHHHHGPGAGAPPAPPAPPPAG